MSKVSSVSIAGSVNGDGISETFGAFNITNLTAPGGVPQNVSLSSGNNTLTPPAGAQWVLIVPPTVSTVAKTIKGVAGDTGIPIAPAAPFLWGLPASPGSFVINAASAEVVQVYWG